MGLGVLGSSSLKQVPGTVHVLEDITSQQRLAGVDQQQAIKAGVKYDRSGKTPIILVPQPSDDPNDPLNWPLWKRDLIIVILSIVSILAACLSSILAANTLTLSLYFGRDFTAIALLTGYHLCGVGVAGVLFVASARVWGKRHLYLLGTILLVASSAWGGASTGYKSMLWARIFQGVAVAPFEALVNASVGDLYFVHQRGIRMALSNLALFGSAFFTPIVVGRLTHTIGWPWSFYFVAIFTAVALPFVVLFVPETTYNRAAYLDTDLALMDAMDSRGSLDPVESNNETHHEQSSREKEAGYTENGRSISRTNTPIPEKVSFARSLLPFNGRKTDDSFFKLLLRPFPLFFQPAIIWACLIQGALIGWTVMIGVVLAAIYLGPPLFFNEEKTGYMYAGPFIGALVGFVLSGLLADWTARVMTRHNKGVYEPEFRIILVIPQLIFGCAGIYGFGITSNNAAKYGWFLPDFFFALEVVGMVIGAVASSLYIVDAHRDISVEVFTCLLIFKNMFSFGLTWSAYQWIVDNGTIGTFKIIGSVQVAVCLLSIPMYILGKKNRAFFHRHDILKMLHLR
ncbi:MAG: hypothetical protein M1816_006754 [Peltula sp. TS41687]|nr:MAG: hypothetical protein M1816_006754 [Peltula sp. TS41687]